MKPTITITLEEYIQRIINGRSHREESFAIIDKATADKINASQATADNNDPPCFHIEPIEGSECFQLWEYIYWKSAYERKQKQLAVRLEAQAQQNAIADIKSKLVKGIQSKMGLDATAASFIAINFLANLSANKNAMVSMFGLTEQDITLLEQSKS